MKSIPLMNQQCKQGTIGRHRSRSQVVGNFLSILSNTKQALSIALSHKIVQLNFFGPVLQ